MTATHQTPTIAPPGDVDTPSWAAGREEWAYEPAAESWYRSVRSERGSGVALYLAAQQRAVMTSPPSPGFPEGVWQISTELPSFDGEMGRPLEDPGAALANLVSWAAWLLSDIEPLSREEED